MLFKLINEQVIKNCQLYIPQCLGMEVRITSPKRSNAQNDYYWNIVTEIGRTCGESKEVVHDRLKWTVLGPDYVELDGKQIARIKPSSSLSKEDFSPLIEGALMTAHIVGAIIPPSNYFGLTSVSKTPRTGRINQSEADRIGAGE